MTSRKAFSLVELLVVISIIALLLAVLLPALGKARQRAKQVVCQSQLRQVGQLLVIYSNENRGVMFPVGADDEPLGFNHPRSERWPVLLFKPPQWNPPILTCPADLEPMEEHSYVLNFQLVTRGIRYHTKPPGGTSTSRIIVMGEKVTQIEDYFIQGPEYAEVVDLHKHGLGLGSNLLYLDLHVDNTPPQHTNGAGNPWDIP